MAYDVIVAGVGGMGSAALRQLAKRGQRVLGLERFDIPHIMGSSHGVNRIIRMPYYEAPGYVPILRRAYALWREIEQGFGEQLLFVTGSVDAGPEDGPLFQGALASAREYGLAHEVLTAAELTERFPAYRLPANSRVVYQPEGGFIASERAIVAHVHAALEAGAEIHARERVLGWEARPEGEGVTVTTDRGTYSAARLVLTAGAWMGEFVAQLSRNALPERQVLAWLHPKKPELFAPNAFPVFNIDVEEGRYYGFPVFHVPGFKVGRYHHRGEVSTADDVRREVDAEDERVLRDFTAKYFPEGNGYTMALRTCIFTNTPDEHFVIDHHPDHAQVVIASPCSGHGYKFCGVVGEIVADLASGDGTTAHDIGFLRIGRPALLSA